MKQSILALAVTMLAAGGAAAVDLTEDGSLKLTGFYSLTGAKVLSGSALGSSSPWTYQQWKCPCTIQGWEYASVYEKSEGWQFDQESLLGVQIKKEFSPTLSATAQLVARANNPNRGSRPTLDWAYLTWQPSADSQWTVQAGQFRIPLYYYSDYLYIGYAYPWVRPMPDVYGWPIYAYQGANVSYRTQLGQSDWAATFHGWAGGYTQHNDAYDTLIYYTTPTHESWKNIIGTSVTANNGVFDLRGMMMWYKDSTWQDGPAGATYTVRDQRTRIMGISANMDYKDWLIKSEVDRYEQVDEAKGLNNIYKYALVGMGYQWGAFTPMLTFSRYRTVLAPIEGRDTRYLSLRWDFRKNTTLKFQYDISKDKTQYSYPFFGDSKLLSISLQGIF
ncbi:porin [Oxalobacteraceae bacterium]|nr:porin [Oxalobacteraceae bacterium]